MSFDKNSLVKNWIEKSFRTLLVAKLNFEKGFYETTINRLYYAVFYMMNAYLQLKNISFKKHSAVRSFFNREFIRTGLLDIHYSDIYNRLYELREEADYSLSLDIEKDKTEWYIHQTENLLKELEKIIKKEMENNDYT